MSCTWGFSYPRNGRDPTGGRGGARRLRGPGPEGDDERPLAPHFELHVHLVVEHLPRGDEGLAVECDVHAVGDDGGVPLRRQPRGEIVSLRRVREEHHPRGRLLEDRGEALRVAAGGVRGKPLVFDVEDLDAARRDLRREATDVVSEDRDLQAPPRLGGDFAALRDQLVRGPEDLPLAVLCDRQDDRHPHRPR